MSWIGQIYRGENDFDFPRHWKKTLAASTLLILISLGSFAARGLNLGIEFEGGTSWEVEAPDLSVAEVRDALRSTPAADAKIQIVGSDTVRVRADIDVEDASGVTAVSSALAELAGVTIDDVNVTTVGPSWGSRITSKAVRALVWFFLLIAAYISFQLEWKMAVGALVAVTHDIILSVGVYSVFHFEVTPATVIAFLTIMGYSLYDTIVVYDRARELSGRLTASGRFTYTEMMNQALNQVLMRSVNTSITSVLPVASMLVIGSFFLGALTLQEFAIALLVGLVVGAYSSLFVAAPVVAHLKEREPAYRDAARRAAMRSRGDTPAAARRAVDQPVRRSATTAPGGGTPRPRKKRKR